MKLHFLKIVVEHVLALKWIETDGVTSSHAVSNEEMFLMVLDFSPYDLIHLQFPE